MPCHKIEEMLNLIQYRHDSVVINKDGKPVATFIDSRLFDRIRRMQGRFDALCERIEHGFNEVSEAEGMVEIEAAIAADREAQGKLNIGSYLAGSSRRQCFTQTKDGTP